MNKEIYKEIVESVAYQFGVSADTLSPETSFTTDLNADSLDVVELSMNIEEAFGLGEISEDELRKISTIADLVDYVERNAAD